MTNEERQYRAAEARRLLNEPLLKEALDELEKMTIKDAVNVRGAEPEDDRMRRTLLERVNVITDLRGKLERMISEGKNLPSRQ